MTHHQSFLVIPSSKLVQERYITSYGPQQVYLIAAPCAGVRDGAMRLLQSATVCKIGLARTRMQERKNPSAFTTGRKVCYCTLQAFAIVHLRARRPPWRRPRPRAARSAASTAGHGPRCARLGRCLAGGGRAEGAARTNGAVARPARCCGGCCVLRRALLAASAFASSVHASSTSAAELESTSALCEMEARAARVDTNSIPTSSTCRAAKSTNLSLG